MLLILPAVAGAFAADRAIRLGLTALDLRRTARARGVPEELEGLLDAEVVERARAFALAKDGLALARGAASLGLTLWLLLSGVMPWFDRRLEEAGVGGAHAFVIFLSAFTLLTAGAHLPFAAWRTFVLERQFGLVRTGARGFLADRLLALLAAGAIGVPALYAVHAVMTRTGPAWWAWLFALAAGLQLGVPWLWAVVLAPRLGRQISLPEGDLRRRLLALASAAGVRPRDIVVVASSRPRQANATVNGLLRPVVRLDEALLARLTEDEVEAVVAHELGHVRLRHTLHRAVVALGASGLLVGLLAAAVAWPQLPAACGFAGPSLQAALALAIFAGGAALGWLAPVEAAASRRREAAADAMAVRLVGRAEPLATALLELAEENLANPWHHPWSVAWRFTHPPLAERLGGLAQAAGES